MSDSVRNAAKTFYIHILIMPEHFCAGVPNQGKFVLVRSLNIFHQGGERVAAAVRGVFAPLYTVDLRNWIFDSAGVQGFVELFTVFLNRHPASVFRTEDGAGNFVFCQAVNDRLDFWGYGNDPVLSCLRLCAAG